MNNRGRNEIAMVVLGALLIALTNFAPLCAADDGKGTLLIVGGGLRPENSAVYGRMISAAGGVERCRFAVFPTASRSTASAERFREVLVRHGVPADQSVVIDIRPENAAQSASDPANVDILRGCTAAFFVGGDQQRITRSFRKPDGSDTPALTALRELWRKGGLIAGTSAGAAMQSETMIGVAGLPDKALDEGMDALDFGLVENPQRRGLLVTPGLGFFRAGIIDQHFSQYRGRLGRLARVTIEKGVRFGFGVDENTAMLVSAEGTLEVVGAGCVTVVDAVGGRCADGPLGCRIDGVCVSCFQNGDRLNLQSGAVEVHAGKVLAVPGMETVHGNHLVPDIAGSGAVPFALFTGLADNTARKLEGVALRYSGSFGHGYKFVFRKTERTRCWNGHVEHFPAHAVHDVDLSIEPITSSLQTPTDSEPLDLPDGVFGTACKALWFRGLFPADEQRRFRPADSITRADFGRAVVQAIHLLPPYMPKTTASDVPESSPLSDVVDRLAAAELIELDDQNRFRPEEPITRQEAAAVFARLARFVNRTVPAGETQSLSDRPAELLKRGEAAVALYRLLEMPW